MIKALRTQATANADFHSSLQKAFRYMSIGNCLPSSNDIKIRPIRSGVTSNLLRMGEKKNKQGKINIEQTRAEGRISSSLANARNIFKKIKYQIDNPLYILTPIFVQILPFFGIIGKCRVKWRGS